MMTSLDQLMLFTQKAVLACGSDLQRLVRTVGTSVEQFLADSPLSCSGWADPGDFNGRLLYEDPQTGFIAVMMTWGPGACTPIHDHGTWGVFGVLEEQIELTNFVRVSGEQVQPVARFLVGRGDVSYVIPPDQEIHQIRNPGERIARSLHFYGFNIGF